MQTKMNTIAHKPKWFRVTVAVILFAALALVLWLLAPADADASTTAQSGSVSASCEPSWPASPSDQCASDPEVGKTGEGMDSKHLMCPAAVAGTAAITYYTAGSGTTTAAGVAAYNCGLGMYVF